MTSLLVTDIAELLTLDPEHADPGQPPDERALGLLHDAALVVADLHGTPTIGWVGPAHAAPAADLRVSHAGHTVLPGFVDSHTHLVFAGDRAGEFAARMRGVGYDGGGIASTVAATRGASDEQLRALLCGRLAELRRQGTTRVEIKTGYGLSIDDELRLLRLAREVTPHTTFLGAHVVPAEYRDDRAAYVHLVTGPMLEAVVAAGDAAYLDVFCEPASPHAFDADESRAILLAGQRAGLRLRVHGNQLGPGPGVQLACELGADSVDHCTYLTAQDVDALAQSDTVATLLPGVEFSTRHPYPDARRLLDAGVTVALATDCNPGTSYTSSMPFVIALAVRELGMTPAQAVYAATAGSARSLGLAPRVAVGEPAELAVLHAPSHVHLAYRPGVPLARPLVGGPQPAAPARPARWSLDAAGDAG